MATLPSSSIEIDIPFDTLVLALQVSVCLISFDILSLSIYLVSVRVEVELDRAVGLEVVAHERAEHLEHARRARAVVIDARRATQRSLVDRVLVCSEDHEVVRHRAHDARNDRRLQPRVLKVLDLDVLAVAGVGAQRVEDPLGGLEARVGRVVAREERRQRLDVRLDVAHLEILDQRANEVLLLWLAAFAREYDSELDGARCAALSITYSGIGGGGAGAVTSSGIDWWSCSIAKRIINHSAMS